MKRHVIIVNLSRRNIFGGNFDLVQETQCVRQLHIDQVLHTIERNGLDEDQNASGCQWDDKSEEKKPA